MNRKILETLRLRRNTRSNASENESVWNLFVQILLPLIFILTFIAVIDILKYRRVYYVTLDENRRLIEEYNEIKQIYDPNQKHFKMKVAILELQKQKLLRALEEVKYEERKTYRLTKFMSGNDVNLSKKKEGKIDDEDFKFLCNNINEIVSDKHEEENYLNDLYQKILTKADVIDAGYDQSMLRVKRWKNEDVLPNEVEIIAIKSGTITKSNRALLHNNIYEFYNDMKEELLKIQTEVLKRIIHKLIENPKAVDETSSTLVKKMLNSTSKTVRQAFANQFYERVTDSIKEDIKREKYFFLDKTWQQI